MSVEPSSGAAKTIAREAAEEIVAYFASVFDERIPEAGRNYAEHVITRALSEQQEHTKDKGRCAKCGKERVLHFPSDHPFASAALSESGAHKEKGS